MSLKLIVRADADAKIGAGHLLRCLALSQTWHNQGGRVVFVTSTQDRFLLDRLTAEEGVEVLPATAPAGSAEDAESTSAIAAAENANWIAVDGYHFDASFQARLIDRGHRVLWIDDAGQCEPYRAQVVLNQNLHANPQLYARRDPQTRLLLGNRFILLRHEFLRRADQARERPASVNDILLLAGGGGSTGFGERALGLLSGLEQPRPRFHCVGMSLPRASEDSRIRRYSRLPDLSGLMAEAQLAISAAGSTAWELAFMGVPALLVSVAENQQPVAAELQRRGAAWDLGWHADLDAGLFERRLIHLARDREARSEMAHAGRELVDGEGADRVVAALLDQPLRLRPVRRRDRRMIWDWANDPEVRRSSFSPEPIPWADHVAWFDRQVAREAGPFWLAIDEHDTAVGQIRFVLRPNNEAEVHIAVRQGQRGRGVGTALLELATRRFFAQSSAVRIHAYIRPENSASLNAFHRAGYHPVSDAVVEGHTVKHYLSERTA